MNAITRTSITQYDALTNNLNVYTMKKHDDGITLSAECEEIFIDNYMLGEINRIAKE